MPDKRSMVGNVVFIKDDPTRNKERFNNTRYPNDSGSTQEQIRIEDENKY